MYNRDEIFEKTKRLVDAYKQGLLGGEKMPEHENPHLELSSNQNYMYFTLPMALNYQRNSYVLWECANRMYTDKDARKVFDSAEVCKMTKQPLIWKKICETIEEKFNGDIRKLFEVNDYSVKKIKEYIQNNKKDFPYLGGNKICNYWLYVLEQYTDIEFIDRENITVAPDTHVVQASQKLGVITAEELKLSNVQIILAERWADILSDTELKPIDVHTPMWLWSRGKFKVEIF